MRVTVDMMIGCGAQSRAELGPFSSVRPSHVKSAEAEFKDKPSRTKKLLRSRNLISELFS